MNPFVLSDETLNSARRRVFTLDVDGKHYFVKKQLAGKARYGPLVQRVAYAVTGNMLLAPTTFADPGASLAYEKEKLERLLAAHIPVPKIVHSDPRYLVLEDVGAVMHKAVSQKPDRADEYLVRAVVALANLHQAGFAHGGAQLKNFTLKDDKVYLIDFEERVEQYPIEEMQLRDVFVFLTYVGRLGVTVNYDDIITRYETVRGVLVRERLAKSMRPLRWITILNAPVFDRFQLHDMKAFAALVDHLKAVESGRCCGNR